MRLFSKWLLLLGLSLYAVEGRSQSALSQSPNIVFILIDDLGYADVGYQGDKSGIHTPNINKLAAEGMRFGQAYAAAPVCSPTRASLLTGLSPAQLKLTCHIPGMGMEKYVAMRSKGKKYREAYFEDRLGKQYQTLASALKEQGYTTAFFGKWHLSGEGSQKTENGLVDALYDPQNMGFDYNYGGCAYGQPSSYFSPYRNVNLADGPQREYLTDRLVDEALGFMKAQRKAEAPFLLYFSTYTVHTPLQVPEDYLNKHDGKKYPAMIEKMDACVGRLLNAINTLELEKETLVVFYSDNGGLFGNAPLRGSKGSLLEGGIRVPMIMRWPGVVEAGSESDTPVNSMDIYPTLLAAADVDKREYEHCEGFNLLPHAVKGQDLEVRSLFWHFPHHRNIPFSMGAAVRKGDWKLIEEYERGINSLFNLKDDPEEQNNLINEYPELAEKLAAELHSWQNSVDAEAPELNKED